MAYETKMRPGKLTLKAVQNREASVDYSYDQWRHAQMRQLERSYTEMLGYGAKPAAA